MEKKDYQERLNTPYPIANTDGLYRVLVATGYSTKNGMESYYDYLTEKNEAVPEDLKRFLVNRYGVRGDMRTQETQQNEYAYRIYRKPKDMDENTFAKEVRREHKVGEPLNPYNPSKFAVCDDLFVATKGDFVKADENGFLLLCKLGSHLENYKGDFGNVLINGREYNDDMELEGSAVDSFSVIDMGNKGIIYPADKNGYYPVDIFYRKGSDPRVRDIQYNFLTPTGEFACQNGLGDPINITNDSDVINRYAPTNLIYTSPYVIKRPNMKPELFPNATLALEAYPILADDNLLKASKVDIQTLDRMVENLGIRYDNGELTNAQYEKGMLVLDRTYESTMQALNQMER